MTLIQLAPNFERFEGLTPEEQSWLIAREYGICNGWRANFVIAEGGASFGVSGDSSDISNPIDRLLLGKLRSLADVIVTSGETARRERYKSSKHAPIAIFTRSGELDTVPAIQGTQYFTPLVLTPETNLSETESKLSDVDVRVLGFTDSKNGVGWPTELASLIRHEGFQSPILESGLSTLKSFVNAGVLDEFCLTVTSAGKRGVSARALAPSYLSSLFGDFQDFELRQLFVSNGTSFSRWVRNGVAAQR